MARLVVNPGSLAAWEIQLKPGTNFIGRGYANDFKIPDGSVSGSHCQLPSMTNFWEDIVLPFLQFVGLTLICFAPAIVLGVWAAMSEESSLGLPVLATFCLGAVYFPMAFLASALLDSVMAANPLQVVPATLKAPLEYLVTLLLLAAVFGIRWLGDTVLPIVFSRGLSTHSMAKLAAFLAAEACWSVACLYLLTVGVHILGLLYVSKKAQFGWLKR